MGTYRLGTTANLIPMSYNDPIFASNTMGTPFSGAGDTLANGVTVTRKSYNFANGGEQQIALGANNTLTQVRMTVPAREGVRIAGSGTFLLDQCWIEVDGVGADHPDCIQAYSPGDTGTLFLNNTAIRGHSAGDNVGGIGSVGVFIADNWTGTLKCRNVLFWGGEYGCRAFPDTGGDMHIDFDQVYFVGPFASDPFSIGDSIGGHVTVIDRWTNVFNATIVGGVIVPGSAIPSP